MLRISKDIRNYNLIRDVSKHLKRGHRWIFSDCFKSDEKFQNGLGLICLKNESLAIALIQSDTNLKARVLSLLHGKNNPSHQLKQYLELAWTRAVQLRAMFPNEKTNSFRLINGEGDGFPGLIIDIYNQTAVIKHDHPMMEQIWDHENLVEKLTKQFPFLQSIYLKRKNDLEEKGEDLFGKLQSEVQFLENGILFESNIRDAAKTGFFLDQRDNRLLISKLSNHKSVLNLFSYTGGFSLFAAHGGAREVTSVDIAPAAIKASENQFKLNNFKCPHHAICEDAFDFLEKAKNEKRTWDLVITDPPSFAPNQKALDKAIEGYTRVFASSIKLVPPGGLFAASSCSSHIGYDIFLEILQNSFSQARRRGTVVYIGGQPTDHPFPLIMTELRYLKFVLFRLDD
ncbi:MAG: class I SAM-dependent rRNA methyltransferase [Bdellovibrio sp.]